MEIDISLNSPRSAGWADRARRAAPVVKLVSLGAIALSLLLLARRLPLGALLDAIGGWVAGLGPWGPVVFGLVYAVAVVLMVPGSALTLAAGALFGLVVGTITVSVASNVGAALAFLIARYVARDAVARRVRRNPRFNAIDRAIGEGGWKIVALLRLSPAVPFNLQNYLYGLTSIRFWPCVLASWVAMLPGTFLYVYLGHVGRAGLEATAGGGASRSPAEWAMIVVGLVATVVVTVYVTRLARRAMREQTDLDSQDDRERDDVGRSGRARAAGWPWGATALALAAILSLGTAVAAELNPELIRRALARIGGPSEVELREAYRPKPSGPTFDHSTFDELLKAHVREGGWVDYRGLARDIGQLDAYLARLARAPFDAMGRDEKLALLINAYNAFTLRLILELYPIDSIKSIPADKRWDAVRWRVGTHTWSLNQIEHEQIRPKFREPRIHFALVCAAVGCPPLRREAYTAGRLEQQLEDQARYVHTHDRWFRLAPGGRTVWLTSLYKWYGGDFEQVAGSVLSFAARYRADLARLIAAGRAPAVRWLDYDWSLNGIENAEGAR
ncbi:VTT domain-containing protein [Tautonia sociabilis]|uniref:DUF547 domain-containing protein n=1 Tax=Tautonia sociabilis TaxID=2080755 RepID=A0A432MKM7_9BACT|nr:VTT domain-containing protein [Tautonia sociabilis]RUL87961.1 DUF547 domain-containing protein [Tautonia sociabilis]